MSGDGTYAPRSPDLSSFRFDAAGPTSYVDPTEPQQLFLPQQSKPDFSHPQYPSSSYSNQRRYQVPPPQTFAQRRPTEHPITSQAPGHDFGVGHSLVAQHEYHPPRAASYPTPGYSASGTGYTAAQAPPSQQQQQQQQQPLYQPPVRGSFQNQYSPPRQFFTGDHLTAAQTQLRQPYGYPGAAATGADPPRDRQPPTTTSHPDAMPPRRAAAAAAAAAVAAQAASEDAPVSYQQEESITAITSAGEGEGLEGSSSNTTTTIEPSPVKTKFPTARIKRIMQADEEVGKVAQQTPIAVGKALELFMVALVTRSAEVARQRNSKRVSGQMLKQVIESDDQWDFLREIVRKVEVDESKKGGASQAGASGRAAHKGESSGTDEEGGGGGGGGGNGAGEVAAVAGKKKRGGGRKKKVQ
ncbi:hypothetical protein N658DRAFT_490766 [Parathielavia hyrcaniae]|uniref:NCT transcriptional regulatory complex subunit A n=1 Tax=Parathielavia hyrcaniae TaxID=113614 RepID=A0AAN6QDB4_9PEZI|nr:hypothetical protein N658DRAFT_490766 [Parathielavia hyrcaniae]